MKSALLTLLTPDVEPLCTELAANQIAYCNRYGIEYRMDLVPSDHKPHPVWHKLDMILAAFADGHELLIWCDMDVAFTNFSRDIRDALRPEMEWGGLVECVDPLYVCTGLMLLRNTPGVIELVKTVKGFYSDVEHWSFQLANHPWEQNIWNDEAVKLGLATQLLTEDDIGGWSPECGFCPIPGRVWKVGDVAVHFVRKDWPERQRLMRDVYPQLIQGL